MSAPPVLSTQGLTVQLAGRTVLTGLDLQLSAGVWTSVIGPNGAGKSTLLRSLAGLQSLSAGQVWLKGRALSDWPDRERARQMAWLAQGGVADAAADGLRCQDVVMLGRLPHQRWLAAPTSVDQLAVEQAMRQTQCWPWRDRVLGQLSGGERQRVLLARALAVQAPVLLMDEPLANLDPPHQADCLATARALAHAGHTVVSVLHELQAALLADEVLVMAEGRVLHHGPSHEAQTHRALEAVFEQRVRVHAVAGQWVVLPQ